MMQEVKLLSERQEVLKGMVEDNIRLQSKATDKYDEQIFQEMKELDERKSKEALLHVQKKHILMLFQNETDKGRRLQRSGSSRRTKKEADSQDLLSVESCRSSAVDHVGEMSLVSPRKIQDVQVVMSETVGKATIEERRRCVEAGTRRGNGDAGNQSCFQRAGRRPHGP